MVAVAVGVAVAVAVVVAVAVAVAVVVKLRRGSPQPVQDDLWDALGGIEGDEEPVDLMITAKGSDGLARPFGHPSIVDVCMGRPEPARGWSARCPLCSRPLRRGDPGRIVLLGDGTRAFVHEEDVYAGAGEANFCRHGVFPAAACTWCNGSERPIYARSRIFHSRRSGPCIECGAEFPRGARIVRTTSAKGEGYAHAFHVSRRRNDD